MIMKNKYILILVAFVLSSAVFAQTTTVWNPAANPAGTGLWTEADNWTAGMPDGDFKVVFNVPGATECVLDDTVSITKLVQGDGDHGETIRVVDGGFLTTTGGWSAVAWSTAAVVPEKISKDAGKVSIPAIAARGRYQADHSIPTESWCLTGPSTGTTWSRGRSRST